MSRLIPNVLIGLIQLAIAIPAMLVLWWLFNFAVYVYDGTTIPMWVEFNKVVFGK